MNLKFYSSVAKGLKLKVRKFLGLVPAFVEVTGEKTGTGGGGMPLFCTLYSQQCCPYVLFTMLMRVLSLYFVCYNHGYMKSSPKSCLKFLRILANCSWYEISCKHPLSIQILVSSLLACVKVCRSFLNVYLVRGRKLGSVFETCHGYSI